MAATDSSDTAADAPLRDPQWLRGVLPLCILAILDEGERYGYDLARRLEQEGLGTVKGGTLYPVLARLERDGALAVRWGESVTGPARKYYALTDAGRRQLAEGGKAWLELTERATALLAPVVAGRSPT